MKAMILKAKDTPLVFETVPDPVPGPGEAWRAFSHAVSGLPPTTRAWGAFSSNIRASSAMRSLARSSRLARV